jgi:hypothetical protein
MSAGTVFLRELRAASPLGPGDFHHPKGGATAAAGDPGIALTFEERAAGEWDAARAYLRRAEEPERVTFLDERDVEHCFWHHGHADTIGEVGGLAAAMVPRVKPTQTIAKAVHRKSKPFLALRLVESVATRGPSGVPPPLARLIETCVQLAREAPRRAVAGRTPAARGAA